MGVGSHASYRSEPYGEEVEVGRRRWSLAGPPGTGRGSGCGLCIVGGAVRVCTEYLRWYSFCDLSSGLFTGQRDPCADDRSRSIEGKRLGCALIMLPAAQHGSSAGGALTVRQQAKSPSSAWGHSSGARPGASARTVGEG